MADVTRQPLSLLEELQAGSGFEAALLTTFNAYLPFVEEVVLRRLRASGCHYVVVLMDRVCLGSELRDRARWPHAAGRRYALLPIACRGAFHPKVAILVGPKAARVIIGSHNLTMSGFIQNREVTNVIEVAGPTDRAGSAALVEALEFCRAWAIGLPSALQQALQDFGTFCRQYSGPVPESAEINVVGSRPDGTSLWQRVRRLLPDRATRVAVLAPFFDQDLSFIRRVHEELRAQELLIGIDPKTACFPGDTKKLPRGFRIVDTHHLNPGHKGRGYLHAKAMLVESGSERILITGSANPTAAAWLAPAGSRNVEIVVIRRLQRRGGDDLGLGQFWREPTIEAVVLAKLRSGPEYPVVASESSAPLIGVCQGRTVRVEGSFRTVGAVAVRDPLGIELASSNTNTSKELVIDVSERAHDAAVIEAKLDGKLRYGFVHHVDLLRDAAVSSSQRRVREALGGLSGDPSQLEALLRLVEKVIFEAPPVESGVRRKGKAKEPKAGNLGESTVELVGTIKKDHVNERHYLGTGDLGLLLDYLTRKLWQSLEHEPSSAIRPETELIGSDDEDLVWRPPTDEAIAEAWHRKSGTLLRRLARRIKEGNDAPQIVVESAAVLGVLEALRRVEDQDRWRTLSVDFVDRDESKKFVFAAVPRLFMPQTGLIDMAAKKVGIPFSEEQGLIEWAIWLAWLIGFGTAEILIDEDEDESDVAIETARMVACECLLGARAAGADRTRIIELLDASPFPGEDPYAWLDSLTHLGATYSNPASASVLERPPSSGDLVITTNGAGPYVVRCVRGDKVDLFDFTREKETVTFRTTGVRVLDSGVAPKRRAVSW